MTKKKVLHLLASNSYSGAENVVCTIIENSKNYEMIYCSPDGKIRDILKKKGIKFVPIKHFNPKSLSKILKMEKIDIIHAHDFKASYLTALTPFRGTKVSQIHCNPDFIKKWNPFSILYHICSSKFKSIILVSDEILKNSIFQNKISNKAIVINPIVDKNNIIANSNMTKTKSYDLCYVGRIIELKNPILFIEIVNELKRYNRNISSCMIGNGDLFEKCENKIKELKLEENIDLLGFKENPYPYLKNSKVCVMPSKYEGFGLVAVESLCLNTPVLNSGAGGLKTIFKNNQEYICNNKKEYISKAIKILNEEKDYTKSINEIIEKYTDIEKYMEKIENSYGGNI